MEKLIKYPIGEQSFESLRRGGYVYVDKTSYIEKILNGSKYFFLSRPRRFGKSLFLSTMKCFFEGKRELFKDLYIDKSSWDWHPYPVLYLDLNTMSYSDEQDLDVLLDNSLYFYEKTYGVIHTSTNISLRLANLIKTMYDSTGRQVVILVDEYDKPLVNNINHFDLFERYRAILGALYSNFKSSADYIRLVFLTGVGRFGKLSVFSGLNNISDISFDVEYSAICGITEDELLKEFYPGLKLLADKYQRDIKQELKILKRHYDGYHFSEDSPDIYNPFSLLQVFAKKKYGNYWIASGSPSLLAQQLRRTDTDLSSLINTRCAQSVLEGLDIENISPVSLFYQTGYLTIKDYELKEDIYTLGIPNIEVKQGFFEYLLPYYTNIKNTEAKVFVVDMRKEMESGCVDVFMQRLVSMFAGFGYDMRFDEERNVQNAFLLIFSLIGINVETEVKTSDGRIDILVRTDKYVYIMELKYDVSAEEALHQIDHKEYSLPWSIDGRTVIAIGINYSSTKRRIDDWRAHTIS